MLTQLLIFLFVFQGAEKGFLSFQSEYSVEELTERTAEKLVKEKFRVYNIIDHAEEAEKSREDLRPTSVLIFGKPILDTQLIQCDQTMGVELPLKILIWQEEDGSTLMGFWDPKEYEDYYELEECRQVLDRLKLIMTDICLKASQ